MKLLKEKITLFITHLCLNWLIYVFIIIFPFLYNRISIKEYFWINGSIFDEKFGIRYFLTVALMAFLAILFYKIEKNGRYRGRDAQYTWKRSWWKILYFFGPLSFGLTIFIAFTIGLYFEFDHKKVFSLHLSRHYMFFIFMSIVYAFWFERLADKRRRKSDSTKALVLHADQADPQLHWMHGINTVIDFYARDTKDFVKTELANIFMRLEQNMRSPSADSERFVIVDTANAPLELAYFLFYLKRSITAAAQRNERGYFKLHAIVFIRSHAKGQAFVILTDGSEVQANGIMEYLKKHDLRHYFPKISKTISVNLLHVNLSYPKNGQLVELQGQTKLAMYANMKDNEIVKIGSIGPRIKDYVGDFWKNKEHLPHEVWDTYVVID
ncbi:hypothetical protein [Sphingobacterium puteale]|uniref:hypothetical protein n=1 Tax=Sphingobacterium puteale TaxID=2420510 RepID=UPI003D959246